MLISLGLSLLRQSAYTYSNLGYALITIIMTGGHFRRIVIMKILNDFNMCNANR